MSEETREFVADEPPEYAGIRPTGHYLMLLLRAAVVDDGRGGPWLYVYRTNTPGGAVVYTHHLSTAAAVESYSENRAVMLSGDEALAFTLSYDWPSLTDPTVAELRALGTFAVELEHVDMWAEWRSVWVRDFAGRDKARAKRAAAVRRDATAVRRALAERWLQTPAE